MKRPASTAATVEALSAVLRVERFIRQHMDNEDELQMQLAYLRSVLAVRVSEALGQTNGALGQNPATPESEDTHGN